jgi:toxin ParE1/3/4
VAKYRVEITKSAESDLLGIYQYISSDNETAAGLFVKKLEQQIGSLEKFPLRCPVIPEAGEWGQAFPNRK